MQFADAIANLREGYAAKRPSWNGYVKKTDVSEDGEAYTLSFIKQNGDIKDYRCIGGSVAFDGPGDDPLVLDGELLGGILKDDWTIGKVADFEIARDPAQDKVW